MNRHSYNDPIVELARVRAEYEAVFGEDSGMMWIDDPEKAVEIYTDCLKQHKPYEELYGEPRTGVNY